MFEYEPDEPVSRRSVLKTTGTVLGSATLLAKRGSAQTGERVRFEIQETTEETITARVTVREELADHLREVPSQIVLGHRGQFSTDAEDGADEYEEDGVATPDVMASVESPFTDKYVFTMQFRTREIDFSEAVLEDGTLTMGLFVPLPGPRSESVVAANEIEHEAVVGEPDSRQTPRSTVLSAENNETGASRIPDTHVRRAGTHGA